MHLAPLSPLSCLPRRARHAAKEEQAARQRRQKVAQKARKVEQGRELAAGRAEQREGGTGELALARARRAQEE